MFKRFTPWIISFVFLVTTACGGGGSSTSTTTTSNDGEIVTGATDVATLDIASNVSLVTTEDSSSSSISASLSTDLLALARVASASDFPADSDFNTEETEIFVMSHDQKPLNMINEILCMADQTLYDQYVNQGAYRATVDAATCSKDTDHGDSNQTGNQRENEEWIVNTTRADENSPQITRFHIFTGEEGEEHEGGPNMALIQARLTVTASATDANPFGDFRMDFIGFSSTTALTDENKTLEGTVTSETLSDGNVGLKMTMNMFQNSDGTVTQFGEMDVNAVVNPAAGTSTARSYEAFDESAFGGGRDRGDEGEGGGEFSESPSFELTGDNVFGMDAFSASSGDLRAFAMDFGSDSHEGCQDKSQYYDSAFEYRLYDATTGQKLDRTYGFPIKSADGTHGWADIHGVWIDGEASTGDVFTREDTDDGEEYTLKVGSVHIMKQTRVESTFAAIVGKTLEYFDETEGEMIRIEFDGEGFNKIGEERCTDQGCEWTDLDSNEIFLSNEYVGFFAPGLGWIDYYNRQEDGETPLIITSSTPLTVYKHDNVTPDEIPSTLVCFDNCPGNFTATQLEGGDPWLANPETVEDGRVYTYSASTLALSYQGTAITWPEEVGAGPYDWGLNSGAMVTQAVADAMDDPWEVWDQDVVYYAAWYPDYNSTHLVDANGEYPELDESIHCEYEHDELGTYQLRYSGWMEGIPFVEVPSPDENLDFSIWRSEFILEEGAELSCEVGGESVTYVTRPLFVERIMEDVDTSVCDAAGLEIDTTIEKANLTWQDPEVGDIPDIDEVTVVYGEVVTAE